MQRGHSREPCFFSEEDYASYVHWLGEAPGDAECVLHVYALMTNHVHLLLTPKKAVAVPKLIMSLGTFGVRTFGVRVAILFYWRAATHLHLQES